MSFHYYINIYIKRPFIQSIAMLDEWFDRSPVELSFKSLYRDWSVIQVLEHIMLFNQKMLLAIGQACEPHTGHSGSAFNIDQRLEKWRSLNYFTAPESPIAKMIEECEPEGVLTTPEIRRCIREQLSHVLLLIESTDGPNYLFFKSSVDGLKEATVDQLIYIMVIYMQHHLHRTLPSNGNVLNCHSEGLQVDHGQ